MCEPAENPCSECDLTFDCVYESNSHTKLQHDIRCEICSTLSSWRVWNELGFKHHRKEHHGSEEKEVDKASTRKEHTKDGVLHSFFFIRMLFFGFSLKIS